jgi:hypothetical protein
MNGGCLRPVRLNVTLPAADLNSAAVALLNVNLPRWYGLPQPCGGLPLPSDSGGVARQNVPRIRAHSIPQWV